MSSDLADPHFESSSVPESLGGERLVLRDMLLSFERNLILTVLVAANGNQKRAADALGVLPTTFQEKLKRFGLINQRQGQRGRAGDRPFVPGEPFEPPQRGGHPPFHSQEDDQE